MTKTLRLLFAALLLVGGCEGKGQKKQLVVGVAQDSPPFHFRQKELDKGFDVELLKAVAKELKMELKIVSAQNEDEALSNLESKSVDLAVLQSPLPQPLVGKISETEPYYKPVFSIVYKKGSTSIDTMGEASGKIGVRGNTAMSDYLEKVLASEGDATNDEQNVDKSMGPQDVSSAPKEMVILATLEEARDQLAKGQIDYLLTEVLEAEIMTKSDKSLTYATLPGDDIQESYSYRLAFYKDSKLQQKVSGVIRRFEDDGKLDILKLRWFSGYIYLGNSAQN